jgi:hypothetical protein
MQWDETPNAGFSMAKPLNAVNPNYLEGVNVLDEMKDLIRSFNFYQYAIAFAKTRSSMIRSSMGRFRLSTRTTPMSSPISMKAPKKLDGDFEYAALSGLFHLLLRDRRCACFITAMG